jgi:hypothetical protein
MLSLTACLAEPACLPAWLSLPACLAEPACLKRLIMRVILCFKHYNVEKEAVYKPLKYRTIKRTDYIVKYKSEIYRIYYDNDGNKYILVNEISVNVEFIE